MPIGSRGFSRLIDLDRRGTGLSDPLLIGALPPLEQRVADVLAVMDAVGSRSAVLSGAADGGQVAILCAAMHPDRVDALYLTNVSPRNKDLSCHESTQTCLTPGVTQFRVSST